MGRRALDSRPARAPDHRHAPRRRRDRLADHPIAARFTRLSESPLWDAQRRYYERAGVDAWRSATVPHHVTNNVALAVAYARVVLGFLRDTRPREPLTVVELGAGAGRFAFFFLRALDALDPDAARRVRYVMTDVAAATLAFWRRHPALQPFVRAGRLDFARFDADHDDTLRLVHAKRPLSPRAPSSALVVIASYVFSGLRHDAFMAGVRGLRECLVTTHVPPAAAPADVELGWRLGPRVTTPYPEPRLSRIASAVARTQPRQPVAFPVGALRCLDRLARLTHGALLVLVADRPGAAPAHARALGLGRHGAVSFPFSVPALRAWVAGCGGAPLRPPHRPRHVHVEGALIGEARSGRGAVRSAWRAVTARGGPDALYAERRRLASAATPSLRTLLALLRRAGPDPRVIAECLRPLWPHLADADAKHRHELRDLAVAAWPSYFHLGEAHDVAFDLGLLLYAVRAYEDARGMFAASLRLYGDDAAVRWNLGLCHVALGRAGPATAAFARARRLAPALRPAGLATRKWSASGVSPTAART
ncbi:MAG TPA: SAM-dependent methyltransferase [Terriglobales bacterium]|nr:SAM-dependent methyltransferase [Terriglobales bacterium]